MDRIGLPLPWGIVPAERVRRIITPPAPAAGADAVVPVPGGVVWVPRTFRVSLTNGAAAANRQAALSLTDGTTEFIRSTVGVNIIANASTDLDWFLGAVFTGNTSLGNGLCAPMPEVPLLGGYTIGTRINALQAADQVGAPVVAVDEYQIRGLERAVERYERAVAEAIAAPG